MQAWQSILAKFNIAITRRYFIANFLGKSMEHVRCKVEEDFDLSLTQAIEDDFHTLLFQSFERQLTNTPGIIEVLSSLRVPFCLATSSSPERTKKALQTTGLLHFFNDRIFTRSLVSRGKPAPDLFLHAAEVMKCKPHNCLVIEDSEPGLAAAQAANMQCLHFIGGAHLHNLVDNTDNTIASWETFIKRFPDIMNMSTTNE